MYEIPVIDGCDDKRQNVGAGQQIAVDREGQNDSLQARPPRTPQAVHPGIRPLPSLMIICGKVKPLPEVGVGPAPGDVHGKSEGSM